MTGLLCISIGLIFSQIRYCAGNRGTSLPLACPAQTFRFIETILNMRIPRVMKESPSHISFLLLKEFLRTQCKNSKP